MNLVDILRQTYILAQTESEDPLTKNAAILINTQQEIIGQGANRLPQRVYAEPSRLERPAKYDYIIHAEQNAIAQAARLGFATNNATLFSPWAACSACARLIIQAGISKVVAHKPLMDQTHMHWPDQIAKAKTMFNEAGVEFIEFAGAIGGVEHTFNGKIWHP